MALTGHDATATLVLGVFLLCVGVPHLDRIHLSDSAYARGFARFVMTRSESIPPPKQDARVFKAFTGWICLL